MVIVAASALASCGEDVAPRAAERKGRVGSPADGPGKRGPDGKVAPHQRSAQPDDRRDRTGPGASASQPAGVGQAEPAGGTAGDADPAQASAANPTASSCVSDPRGDLDSSGTPPSYVDLVSGCVGEAGGVVTVEATAAGTIPPRTDSESTHASVGFELTPPSGPSIFVYADAGTGGWTAHLSRGDEQRELPGALTISGDQLRIAIPASELGDARELYWNATSSWLESTLLSTSYAFDAAPDGSSARFVR